MSFKEVKIWEIKFSVLLPRDKADTFIRAVREKLGEISIGRGGDGSERGGCLISVHIPALKKEQFYSLLRDFCKEHNLPLDEKTSQ